MIRMIFSTVRAPHDPALTVESFAISATGRPSINRRPGDDAVRGSPLASALANRPSSVKRPCSTRNASVPGRTAARAAAASW